MRRPPIVSMIGGAVLTMAVVVPSAVGSVAGATLTGPDGSDQAVNAALVVRNLKPTLRLRPQPGAAQYYDVTVTGPNSLVAATASCDQLSSGLAVGYRGNGAYTISVTSHADSGCDGGAGPPQTFSYRWLGGVSFEPAASRQLIRGTGVSKVAVPVQSNSGGTVEVRYAKDGNFDRDGALIGGGTAGGIDLKTGTPYIRVKRPGTYAAVARQVVGAFATPWSKPLVLQAVVPFKVVGLRFPDTGGPVYQLRGRVSEPTAAGDSVTIALARGRRAGNFSTVSEVHVRRGGYFSASFRRSSGSYRLRVSFKGGPTVERGSQIKSFTIRAARLRY